MGDQEGGMFPNCGQGKLAYEGDAGEGGVAYPESHSTKTFIGEQ